MILIYFISIIKWINNALQKWRWEDRTSFSDSIKIAIITLSIILWCQKKLYNNESLISNYSLIWWSLPGIQCSSHGRKRRKGISRSPGTFWVCFTVYIPRDCTLRSHTWTTDLTRWDQTGQMFRVFGSIRLR